MPYKIENGRLVNPETGTSYSVTPEHLPIFEAMGTVEDGDFEVKKKCRNVACHCHALYDHCGNILFYAIPRKNEDVWEEALDKADEYATGYRDSKTHRLNYLKQHYTLTRKK